MHHGTVLGDANKKSVPQNSPVMHCQRRYSSPISEWRGAHNMQQLLKESMSKWKAVLTANLQILYGDGESSRVAVLSPNFWFPVLSIILRRSRGRY